MALSRHDCFLSTLTIALRFQVISLKPKKEHNLLNHFVGCGKPNENPFVNLLVYRDLKERRCENFVLLHVGM